MLWRDEGKYVWGREGQKNILGARWSKKRLCSEHKKSKIFRVTPSKKKGFVKSDAPKKGKSERPKKLFLNLRVTPHKKKFASDLPPPSKKINFESDPSPQGKKKSHEM